MASLMGMGLVGQLLGKDKGGGGMGSTGLVPGMLSGRKAREARPNSTILTDALQRRRGVA